MRPKTKEDYLHSIYLFYERLENKEKGVRSVDIAREMSVTKASVSQMLKKLSREGLIKIELYSKIHLTRKGLKIARKITRMHRVIEVFLLDALGYSAEKVHEEAHKLEHAFSEESIKRLEKFLKKPKRCPHGGRI